WSVAGLAAQVAQELGQVVQESAEAGGIAALFLVHAGTPAVEEIDGETGRAQAGARVRVPAGMALDAVQAHNPGQGSAGGPIAAKLPAVAVGGGETLDRKSDARLHQVASPWGRSQEPGARSQEDGLLMPAPCP